MIYRIKKTNGGKPTVVHFITLAPFAGNIGEAPKSELGPPATEMNFDDYRMNTRWQILLPEN